MNKKKRCYLISICVIHKQARTDPPEYREYSPFNSSFVLSPLHLCRTTASQNKNINELQMTLPIFAHHFFTHRTRQEIFFFQLFATNMDFWCVLTCNREVLDILPLIVSVNIEQIILLSPSPKNYFYRLAYFRCNIGIEFSRMLLYMDVMETMTSTKSPPPRAWKRRSPRPVLMKQLSAKHKYVCTWLN